MEMKITAVNIDGTDYFTVQQFATLCGKGLSRIYGLIHREMLKSEVKLNKTLIPASELAKAEKLFGKSQFKYTGAHYG